MKKINNNFNIGRSARAIFTVLLMTSLFYSCKEEIVNTPTGAGVKPERVTEVQQVSGAGKSTLTFRLKDANTLYVMAVYEIRPGEVKEVKTSKYTNQLVLDGFGREGKYPVKIYAVSEGEVRSDAFDFTIDVQTPPVMEAFKSLNLREDFGGMNISLANEHEGDISIDVLTKNVFGNIALAGTYYSSQKDISFSIRGFTPDPRDFYVVIRDRWKNVSDTARVKLAPLYEELLDRTKMGDLRLPTDVYQGHTWSGLPPREIKFMFDGNSTDPTSVFHVPNNIGIPLHFTINLGKVYKLSRFKLWMRNQDQDIFNGMSARYFEVYGSNAPNGDGSWDSWTLIGDYEMKKPSGLPRGTLNAEDRAAHASGMEFNIPIDAAPVRYLRFKIKETWGLSQTFSNAEMGFWGAEDK